MKKFIFISFLIPLLLLTSCSVFPLLPSTDKSESEPIKVEFLSSQTMFSDFFIDVYTSGTELQNSDFEKINSTNFRKNDIFLSINSLSILGRELASKDKELSLAATSLNDNKKDISHKTVNLTYGSEKFSSVLFSTENSSIAALSCIADTYYEFKNPGSLKEIVSNFLSSDEISTERFTKSRTDCRYGEAVIKDTQKITLDLEGVNLSPLISDVLECIDPIWGLSDKKEFILNNISSPKGTEISVYFKDRKPICAEFTFTFKSTEYRTSAFLDLTDLYQSAKISFAKSSSPSVSIFHLDFIQVITGDQKKGEISVNFYPIALFENNTSLPSSITLDASYETTISNNRQNCSITAVLEYTLFGITSSYKLPISIVTELLDNVFSMSVSMSAENEEITDLDARLSFTVSAQESLDIPIISPEKRISIETKEQAYTFISDFSSGFERKYPNIRYLIFKNYTNQEQVSGNIITIKSEENGETFIFHTGNLNSVPISGNGEYIREFTYTESENSFIISEKSTKNKYSLYIPSSEITNSDDSSIIYTDKDGTIWRLFPDSMTGYFSRPVNLSISLDESRTSGTFSIYFLDSNIFYDNVNFNLSGEYITFENNEYKYFIY